MLSGNRALGEPGIDEQVSCVEVLLKIQTQDLTQDIEGLALGSLRVSSGQQTAPQSFFTLLENSNVCTYSSLEHL